MTHGEGEWPVVQDEDVLPERTIVLVVIGAVGIAVAFVIWAFTLLEHPAAESLARRPGEVGLAQPPLFDESPGEGPRRAAEQRRRLESWGWVDRAGGVAHAPIEEAMRLVVGSGP